MGKRRKNNDEKNNKKKRNRDNKKMGVKKKKGEVGKRQITKTGEQKRERERKDNVEKQ